MDAAESRFEQAMLDLYCGWRDEIGYKAARFLQLVRAHGGVRAAHILLASSGTSPGFERLARAGRLDMTVERLVLSSAFVGLFTPNERAIARRRLIERGMSPDRLPPERTSAGSGR
jgi:hypothetical protein